MRTINLKVFTDGKETNSVQILSKEPHKNFSPPVALPDIGEWTVHFSNGASLTASVPALNSMFPGWRTITNKERWVTILISPQGEECYLAHGPNTKNFAESARFSSEKVANEAAISHFGYGNAFWDCELATNKAAQNIYFGWTHRVISAYDTKNYRLAPKKMERISA